MVRDRTGRQSRPVRSRNVRLDARPLKADEPRPHAHLSTSQVPAWSGRVAWRPHRRIRVRTILLVDMTSLVTPGAQALVTAILSDSWIQARSALAHLWARHDAAGKAANGSDTVEGAGRELDAARDLALVLAGPGSASDQAARMQLFLAGYLAGQLTARPDLAGIVAGLPALVDSARASDAASEQCASAARNSIAGTVHGNVVQTRDVQGGIAIR